jgi:hypothetical protein
MYLRISATPSNTPSNTPTYTPTSTICPTPTNTSSPTASPTSTLTPTPSVTSCYEPKAFLLFDSFTDRLNLNAWMLAQGSAFRGMHLTSPSLSQVIFEEQMNDYINYSGWGLSNNAIMYEPTSYNEDPINIVNTNVWSSDETWVSAFVPICAHCPGSYSRFGVNAINVSNTSYSDMIFYYSGSVVQQGYYRLYTTKPGLGNRYTNYETQYSVSGLTCTGITPTPTITTTSTSTPTMTPTQTPNPLCPEQLYFSAFTGSDIDYTFNRLHTYSGGSLSYGWYSDFSGPFYPNQTLGGNAFAVFGAQSGSTYYTIIRRGTASPQSWKCFVSTGDYIINGGISVSGVSFNTALGILSDGIYYPPTGFGIGNNSYLYYSEVCPTSTPTITPTNTSTPSTTPSVTPTNTATSTSTSTPNLTPTNTSSSSPTPSVTPTNTTTPPVTPTNTATPTSTSTPNLTPTNTSSSSPTPSVTATITSTPTASSDCLCFSSMTVDVTSAGNITFKDCNNIDRTWDVLTGIQEVGPDPDWCIQKNTNGGTALYTIISYNDCCSVPPTSTPTATPTATPNSTPTTTPTNTPSPTNCYVCYNATQYLNCVQNSSPGQYLLRVPCSLDSGTWWCGDDGYQYQFDSNATCSETYDVTAVSNASPSSCQNLSC